MWPLITPRLGPCTENPDTGAIAASPQGVEAARLEYRPIQFFTALSPLRPSQRILLYPSDFLNF